MWKNSGNPSFHWKLKHVSADNNQEESYNVLARDLGKYIVSFAAVTTQIAGTLLELNKGA